MTICNYERMGYHASMTTASSKPTGTTRRRRPKHDPKESEREILDAAEQLLRERPFREINVEEVMRRTGLKRPAFYVHFRDRHDLVLRVAQRIGRQLFAMSNHWLQGDNPGDDLRAALEGLVSVYRQHGPVLRAITDAATTDERVDRAYRAIIEDFVAASARHIRAEQSSGRIDPSIDVEETARALTLLDERYLSESFGRTPQADPELVVRVLHNIWMATLYGGAPKK